MKTIFDVGSNNGDDLEYYLLKADKVVAFEANPILCKFISTRFAKQIEDGQLTVENGVLCTDRDAKDTEAVFYLHKESDVLSQFPKPDIYKIGDFKRVILPVIRISDVIQKYGIPYYIKIDVEHYDKRILEELFRLEVYPTYLSAECHSRSILKLLKSQSEFVGFKLVEGEGVAREHGRALITRADGTQVRHAFLSHSAGPFGNDIPGPWYDRRSISRLIGLRGFGWIDVHVSRLDQGHVVPMLRSYADYRVYLTNLFNSALRKPVTRAVKKVVARF